MEPFRAVIVDDEPMARQALRRMLAEFPDIEICGEADTVATAAALIDEIRANVVYLDIELIGERGFDLVPFLDEDMSIVFVTAFDQYAIRAFEVNALDYLLKPVTRERLSETVRRLRDRKPPSSNLSRMKIDDTILVFANKRRHWMSLEQVCLIEANADLSIIRSIDGLSSSTWRSISGWERILPEERFIRIHRGRIVNMVYVERFETISGNRLRLYLTGIAEPCNASRRRTPTLRKRLRERAMKI